MNEQLINSKWARRSSDTVRTVIATDGDSITAKDQHGLLTCWNVDLFVTLHDRIPEAKAS